MRRSNMRRFTCQAPTAAKPIESTTSVSGDAAGAPLGALGVPAPAVPGPATEPEISRLLETPVSRAMPLVANETVPLGAVGAVTVKPITRFATLKLPVPQVVFVQTTFVPPFNTDGV